MTTSASSSHDVIDDAATGVTSVSGVIAAWPRHLSDPLVAPVAVGRDFLCGVIRFVDAHAIRAEFDVPVAGRADVERHHFVVGVTSEGGRQLEALGVDAVQCLTDGIEGVDFDHDVDEAWVTPVCGWDDRQAVVSFVDPEEANPYRAKLFR